MNKKILIAIALSMIAFYGTSRLTAQPTCEVPSDPMPTCQDGRRITINNEAKTYAPRNLCVEAGDVIEVNVTPNGTSASMSGKDASDSWLNNSGPSFTITVPGTSGVYDYNVIFSDGSCKDPRITVK